MSLWAGAASAREVVVTGSKMNRFGRILLHFDETTKVQVKATASVLVISFAEPARIRSEKLATEIGPYVSVVRRDPDSTGLRLALAAPLKVNVLEAGERVYIDLLPQGWSGLPPSLPPEVVADLAERARKAETTLKGADKRPDAPKPVRLRVAELPAMTRLVFEPPPGTSMRAAEAQDLTELAFDGALTLDGGDQKPKLAAGVESIEAGSGPPSLTVKVKPAAGYSAHTFREGDTLVLDLAKPSAARPVGPEPTATPKPAVMAPASAEAAAASPPSPPAKDGRSPPASSQSVSGSRTSDASGGLGTTPSPVAVRAPGTVKARVETGEGGPSILFPFAARPPAAAFERGGRLTLVFDTPDSFDVSTLTTDGSLGLRAVETSGVENGLAVLRVDAPGRGPARFSPAENGWRLSFGADAAMPPDAVAVARASDENGRGLVRVGLAGASRSHWLRDPDGTRLAVVTAAGRVQGLPLPRSFVEFALPATLHGVVVEPRADDVTVSLGQSGVTITRDAGLALSTPGKVRQDGTPGATPSGLVLTREAWIVDSSGDVLDRYNALVSEAAEAPRSGRAEARFRFARFLVANGMNEEAAGVLSLARREDPVFARRRETGLLSGIAAARSGRAQEARAFLGAEGIGEDQEAVLWRAVVDALDRRWASALAGFRRASEIVELYPDDLVGPIRLLTLSAAIEVGDLGKAEGELAAIDRLAVGSIDREEHDLARAKLDDAAGRTGPALTGYFRLMEEGNVRVSAEAARRWVALGLKTEAVDRPAAIARLETLSVAWRGGETEIGTISDLARLYGEAGRWRDMFGMTRRANVYFPDHPLTRALHDHSAQQLEKLLLGGDGAQLNAVQALALYFDFKELAPIGRRGDEVVRRLADRLVELDLLDQAAELLQHQVDKRLSGAARATVAARLAAIRLISGKPLMALTAIQTTRLAELPANVRRLRMMLEARAHSDLSRSELALEVIDGEAGADFNRLRTGILWTARRWRDAGEAGEALLGTRWRGPEPLTERERGDLIRAATAYALAEERISLDRLKGKFAAKMMDSPDAKTFELLMRPGAAQTREFRAVAQEATRADALKLLLSDWLKAESASTSVGEPGDASGSSVAPTADRAASEAASGRVPGGEPASGARG